MPRDRSPISSGDSGQQPADSLADRPPLAIQARRNPPFMVVTLALPGKTETEDKLRIRASGTSEALALEREPMTGRARMGSLLSRTAYTTSGPWQHWIVSSFWPERTKSSVGASLGKSGNVLELIPFYI